MIHNGDTGRGVIGVIDVSDLMVCNLSKLLSVRFYYLCYFIVKIWSYKCYWL